MKNIVTQKLQGTIIRFGKYVFLPPPPKKSADYISINKP